MFEFGIRIIWAQVLLEEHRATKAVEQQKGSVRARDPQTIDTTDPVFMAGYAAGLRDGRAGR